MSAMIPTKHKYILVNGKPKLEQDLIKWATWYETSDEERIVGKTVINDIEVSTVFLGLDHGFGVSRLILYESMVFGGRLDGEQNRYSTLVEAWKGHRVLVKKVREIETERLSKSVIVVNLAGSRRIHLME